MKKLFLLIISLFWFSAQSQTTAEISSENTLPAIENNSDRPQDYPEDLPWHARRFKVSAGVFFPLIIQKWNTVLIMVNLEI